MTDKSMIPKGYYPYVTIVVAVVLIIAIMAAIVVYHNDSAPAVTPTPAPVTTTIADMAGRTVTVPASIQKVSCIHPIATYMTWRLAPDKLISIDKIFNSSVRLMPDSANRKLASLPVTGYFGGGLDKEQMLLLGPDAIVSMNLDHNLDQEQSDFKAPVVALSKANLSDYEADFRLMGRLLGNEKDGNELADDWNATIKKVTDRTSRIPQSQRIKVYYASHDGVLSTVGPDTVMASIIRMAGGVNYYDGNASLQTPDSEHLTVNIEDVLKWDPDVIITKTSAEKNQILSSPQWKDVKAVKNNRVYSARQYESLDGIQSIMGLEWTTNVLYPEYANFDFKNDTRAFYSEFYRYDNMTDDQIMQEQH